MPDQRERYMTRRKEEEGNSHLRAMHRDPGARDSEARHASRIPSITYSLLFITYVHFSNVSDNYVSRDRTSLGVTNPSYPLNYRQKVKAYLRGTFPEQDSR